MGDSAGPVALVLLAAMVGVLVVEVGYRLLRGSARWLHRRGGRTGRPGHVMEAVVDRVYRPIQLLAALAGPWLVVATGGVGTGDGPDALRDGLAVALAVAAGWLGITLLLMAVDTVQDRIRFGGSDNARRFHSQAETLRRLLTVAVAVLVILIVVTTIDQLQSFGTAVLAAGGLIGAIAGLAAQRTLANMFAGIALAFNDTLNIHDVVEVDGQSGEVVERTLTQVVVKLSDQRRLVLPTSHLLDNPFRSWRITRRWVAGFVPLELDWTVPVAEMDQELRKGWGSPKGRYERVEVIGAANSLVQVRAVVSALPDDLWDVECDVRRHLVEWLRSTYPDALPRVRAAVSLSGTRHSVS